MEACQFCARLQNEVMVVKKSSFKEKLTKNTDTNVTKSLWKKLLQLIRSLKAVVRRQWGISSFAIDYPFTLSKLTLTPTEAANNTVMEYASNAWSRRPRIRNGICLLIKQRWRKRLEQSRFFHRSIARMNKRSKKNNADATIVKRVLTADMNLSKENYGSKMRRRKKQIKSDTEGKRRNCFHLVLMSSHHRTRQKYINCSSLALMCSLWWDGRKEHNGGQL